MQDYVPSEHVANFFTMLFVVLKTSSEDKLGATHCIALFAASNCPDKAIQGREEREEKKTNSNHKKWSGMVTWAGNGASKLQSRHTFSDPCCAAFISYPVRALLVGCLSFFLRLLF